MESLTLRASTITIAILTLLISSNGDGESRGPKNPEAKEFCGYGIEGKLAGKVTNINSEAKNGIRQEKINATIKLGKRQIPVSIEFSCHTSPATTTEEIRNAKSEIETEDSGGRYYRIVNWEKEIRGKNWLGTMIYVNAIFGDGEKSTIPDQFLACPKASRNPCFYINVAPSTHLSKAESMQVKKLLVDISIEP